MLTTKRKPATVGEILVEEFMQPMGLTQAAGTVTPVKIAAGAILIAAASNNIAKGIYAYSLADRKTGVQALLFLLALAGGGLLPLVWFM